MIISPLIGKRNPRIALLILGVGLLLCLICALMIGTVNVTFEEVFSATFFFNPDSVNSNQIIINKIRIPRLLLAVLIGAVLAMCGAITQGLFRNPLADPSLIGVTAGASAGAAAFIVLGLNLNSTLGTLSGLSMVSIGAFIGGVCTVFLVYRLATSSTTGTSVATMLLAGIAIAALATSITSLLEFSADNEMLRRISLWRMGGLDGASYTHVSIAAVVTLLLLFRLPAYSIALNALLLGESEAKHLGIKVQRIKIQLIVIVAAGVGVAVALSGTIVFVGLVVPHIMRLMLGPNHKILLPASALGGAILLLLSDTIARSVIAPVELPVGLVTSIVGAPFFISLLRHRHQFGMQ